MVYVLDLLRILLSGPVVVGVVVIFFLRTFRAPLETLIQGIIWLRFPGGEVRTSQATRQAIADRSSSSPEPLGATETKSQESPQPSIETTQRLVALWRAERERAYLWEYRYLNYFLVPTTQITLDWLAQRKEPTTWAMIDNWLQPFVHNPQERAAILTALQSHYLVSMDGNGLITATPKGREYIEFRTPWLKSASAPTRTVD